MLLEADRYKPSMLNANEQMLTHLKQKESLQVATNTFHYVIKMNNKLTFLSSTSSLLFETQRASVPLGLRRHE